MKGIVLAGGSGTRIASYNGYAQISYKASCFLIMTIMV